MNELFDIWNISLPSDLELEALPKPSILLVDDRDENLVATRKLLERLDARIVLARSGTEALSLTLRERFAVILLDVQMPIMDGFETADLLRQNEATARTPLIFVTAISKDERYVHQGYDVGAVDYIFKPLDPAILLSKVRVFLELERQQLALQRLALTLEQLNQRHRALLESAAEGILGVDATGRITFANPTAQRLLGAENQLVGSAVLPFIEGPDVAPGHWTSHPLREACVSQRRVVHHDATMYRQNGHPLAVEYNFAPLPLHQGMAGGVLLFQDIALRKALAAKLERMAKYDDLTGIANRQLFQDLLGKALHRARRAQQTLPLLFLDLDGFKAVNDTHGHQTGDMLLRAFVGRVQELVRDGDVFGRQGGDEFVLLLENGCQLADAEAMAQRLIEACSAGYEIDGHLAKVGVSVGIAQFPDHAEGVEGLLKAADHAMYAAKSAGRNTWRVSPLPDAAATEAADRTPPAQA